MESERESEFIEYVECIETNNIAYEESDQIDINEINTICIAEQEYLCIMEELEITLDKQEWYFKYKDFIEIYKDYFGEPETIYDVYTPEEIYLIQRTVETECFDASFESKANVASVILNRIEFGGFGKNITEVITKKNQFAYWRKDISDSTILAIEFAYEIGDTTNGCVAFRSDKQPQKWYGWEYQFSDNAVHHFYK